MLELKGLYKTFGGLQAISNLSFCVEENEILALIGPNGAGKTTVFNIITGFLLPDKGEVRFQGEDIIALKPHKICVRGIARTFQIVRPFLAITVLNNVIVGALNKTRDVEDARKKAEEVLDLVGLREKKELLASSLTLPDRKRLELARALATNPTLLLLDEVMAGLTPSEIDHLIKLLRIINQQGITIFLIEHVMRAVMALSDRVIVINYGTKIAEGSPKKVTNNPEVIKAYLGEEFYSA